MMGLVSITHLLSASVPNISLFSTSTCTNTPLINARGLGMEASGISSGLSSLPCTPLDEERPGSSLSTASRSSRIPRLTRSASLRIKSSTSTTTYNSSSNHTPESKTVEVKSSSDPRPTSRTSSKGITRSASFVTSRGMGGITRPSSSSTTNSMTPTSSSTSSTPSGTSRVYGHSLTPETPRRFTHPGNHTRRVNNASSDRKTHASQPETPSRSPNLDLDDVDSVKSFGSVCSAVSCDAGLSQHLHHHQSSCGSSSSSRGGGGRNLKYVLHCRHNHDYDPDNYLTPTQRAARRIRELKNQLAEARREVHLRDAEISRLTRELVELRLLKARSQQREDEAETNTERNDKITIRRPAICNGTDLRNDPQRRLATEPRATPSTPTPKTSATPSEGSEPELSRLMDNLTTGASESGAARVPVVSPAAGSVAETTSDSVDLTRSLADSGHYEDLTSPCLSSRFQDPFEASRGSLRGRRVDEDEDEVDPWTAVEETEARLREEYERREDQLKRNHMDEYHELKEKHNDRVEALLSKLSDANLKYFELRPMYDRSQERIRELERDVTRLKDELTEAELRHQKMYLQMFLKGQQAAKLQADDEQDGEDGSQSSISSGGPVVDLMKQLARTEEELEKIKGAVPLFPCSLSSPVVRALTKASSLGAPKAALLDGKQAISLYFQGRRQALYHREVASRNNNNNNNNSSSTNRNGELDPEVTLQFLKSAIYYFLTDKDNSKGHLRAIESILGYSDSERYNIDKVVK
ncbi:location of vulva defective 1-like isoform X6 [Homarus americanus]|uniref:location of vulva defective 1-like isoform X6 n=1 Tax=Homarus americanus TaxID=6706 RepID=UPI001C487704|nr:location of vulva defective 1-like isoform X6 [Homarus americanus]